MNTRTGLWKDSTLHQLTPESFKAIIDKNKKPETIYISWSWKSTLIIALLNGREKNEYLQNKKKEIIKNYEFFKRISQMGFFLFCHILCEYFCSLFWGCLMCSFNCIRICHEDFILKSDFKWKSIEDVLLFIYFVFFLVI